MAEITQDKTIHDPHISPLPGFYNSNTVKISVQYPYDQIIFFTLDGTIPVEYVSPRYCEPIELDLNYDCVTVTLLLYRHPNFDKRYLQFEYCYYAGDVPPYYQYGYWYYYRDDGWHWGKFDFDEDDDYEDID